MAETVLVTAATGTVGRHVVTELVDRGATALAGTRDPDGAGDALSGGARPVAFDFERPETWGSALEGVDGLFLVRPPGVARGRLTDFADAAARVGVGRVAYLSTLGAERNPLIPHHRIERHLADAAVDHAFLRASFFAQNLHEVHARDVVERDEISVPAGDGATSFVDARDVGAVGAAVLTERGHRNVAYDLTGPEALTYDEVAAAFSDALGRRITYGDPSIPAFIRREYASGRPLGFALLMVGVYTTARLGLADRVTGDVERLLNRPPRTIRDYVRDYADEFRRE
ncbi:SDR family oxidoreductase [Halomicrobium urmianum]|uniref:SDR family oxidoreductase n=1 Tax=Halomicrobium urmianum TaxID=1586233 RepID=UPI001CD9717D|nr:SDR family oxidoreductase [Halomicrobium urmianum]